MIRVSHKAWRWKGELLHTSNLWAWVLWDQCAIPQTAMANDLEFEGPESPRAWTAAEIMEQEG